MKYADYRDRIRSGDVLAWSHIPLRSFYDLLIWIVRIVTVSEYAHVGLALKIGGRVWVLESVSPVVRLVPLSNLLPVYVIPIGTHWTPEVEEYALSLVGKAKYSRWEAVKAFFGQNEDDEAWECAELVKEVLEKAHVRFAGRAVPSDVVLAAQKRCGAMLLLE